MTSKIEFDLREALIDAHANFFMLKGEGPVRLRLWEIRKDSLVIDRPVGAPLLRTMLGYVPVIDGSGVYEIEGTIDSDVLPDQMPGTIRLLVDESHVKRLNRRVYPRVSFAPPIDASISIEGGASLKGRIINLSAGGLRVECRDQLPATSNLTFGFDVECDDEIHSLSLKGAIVYELPIESGYAYGVRFLRETAAKEEASIETIERAVDLIHLLNRLIVSQTRS